MELGVWAVVVAEKESGGGGVFDWGAKGGGGVVYCNCVMQPLSQISNIYHKSQE